MELRQHLVYFSVSADCDCLKMLTRERLNWFPNWLKLPKAVLVSGPFDFDELSLETLFENLFQTNRKSS